MRARWSVEREKGGGWQVVVTEIPYGVQKGKLIEQIAELINAKRLPNPGRCARTESDELVRLVLEPRSRTVDVSVMMDGLFRLSDLETRVPLNLNVLDNRRTPRVMSLKEALAAWVEHQFVVLRRKTEHRLGKIADRLELVAGYIIAYLNLDRVIAIIRAEEEPKACVDRGVRSDRSSGRGDPEHAASVVAQAGGDGAARRARQAGEGAG